MASKLICNPDTEMKIIYETNMIRIFFQPVGRAAKVDTFVDLKVHSFTKKNGFRIRIPGVLQQPVARPKKDDRKDIAFRATLGDSEAFKAHILNELTQQVHTWRSFRDAFTWFQEVAVWKRKVIHAWRESPDFAETHIPVCLPCKRPRSPNVLASIPVYLLPRQCKITLRQDSSRKGQCKIRLRVPGKLTDTHTKKKSHLQMTLPSDIPGDLQRFAKFVGDYVATAALNWATLDEAKAWASQLNLFISLVVGAWRRWYEKLFWEIKPSEAPYVDLSQGTVPRGSGLFCTIEGKHKIYFGQPPLSCWIRTAIPDDSVQERYAIGGKDRAKEGYTYFLPTDESFRTGVIHHGFKLCHSKTPTHSLEFDKHRKSYWLKPLKVTYPGDEFTFDYLLENTLQSRNPKP